MKAVVDPAFQLLPASRQSLIRSSIVFVDLDGIFASVFDRSEVALSES
jgi:hypothetical protein